MTPPYDTHTLQDWDRRYIWHPFTQMQDYVQAAPLVIARGEGVMLYDTDGNAYIDGVSSLWTNVLGHQHPIITAAIKEQVDNIAHSTLLGLANVPSTLLAKQLVDITPQGLTKVFYSDSGSSAVEIALKIAYQYCMQNGKRQKKKIAHIVNAYHGDTLGSVSVGGMDLFHHIYRDLLFDTVSIALPESYRHSDGDWGNACMRILEDTLATHADSLAACIIEPLIQGAAGMLLFPPGYLKRVRELTEAYDIFLIADEVATGFGRTGRLFACEHEAITPDILCLAKGLSGGYLPLAATLTTDHLYEGFLGDYADKRTFFHGHTYTGNPLACASALATLNLFEQAAIVEKLPEKIQALTQHLSDFYRLPHVGDIRQCGMMVGIELVRNKKNKTPYAWEEKAGISVTLEARKHGVIIRPLGNVVVIMPPLSISLTELEALLTAIYKSIETVTPTL